jgi:hypothetical protein
MRNRLQILWLVVCLFAGSSMLAAPPARAPHSPTTPTLAFDGSSIRALHMTPSGDVVWLGVGTATDRYSDRELIRRQITTADASGMATLNVGEPVPLRSVWFAVDLSTGDVASSTPGGFAPRSMASASNRVGPADEQGDLQILSDRLRVIGIAVRPGDGAWAISGNRTGEGLPTIATSGASGSLRQDQATLGTVQETDVVIIVDPLRLDCAVVGGAR